MYAKKRLATFFLLLGGLFLAVPGMAQDDATQWEEGKHYFLIDPVQPTVADTDKVEVVEIFSFVCPACNHARSTVEQMRDALPQNATMSYLHASFRPDENWPVYQRAWYTAQALGMDTDAVYDATFKAAWDEDTISSYNLETGRLLPKAKWPTIENIAAFYQDAFDQDAEEFAATADSFAIKTQMQRADKLIKSYGVMGTPSFVVNGKYRFDFQSAGGYAQGIELAQWLVEQAAEP